MFDDLPLRQRIIRAFVSAIVDGEAFPKIHPDVTYSRYDVFALVSECDEPIPLHLCEPLGVPTGATYSDAAVVAALREAGKPKARPR
jgi:hypothetical protein